MQYRQLGNTDLQFSAVGFGAWAIGGIGWGPQDDAESIAAIRRALEVGVNWIDTAAVYGVGHSEEVVGQAIAGRRAEVLIATKCTRRYTPEKGYHSDARPESIRQEIEDSLRRLQTDVIDLYQIHWPDPNVPVEDTWGAMADLVKEGKVRYLGVSNFDVPLLETIQPIHPAASLQPPYSLLRRDVEAEILPYCHRQDIGVIAYSPMQSGLLTGRFDLANLAPGDWRRNKEQAELERAATLVDRLRPLAEQAGKTMSQLAVAWVNAQPGITAAIVGARRPAQIEETALAGDWDLSEDELAAIANVLAEVG